MMLGAIIGAVVGIILSEAHAAKRPSLRGQDALGWAVIGALAGLLIAATL